MKNIKNTRFHRAIQYLTFHKNEFLPTYYLKTIKKELLAGYLFADIKQFRDSLDKSHQITMDLLIKDLNSADYIPPIPDFSGTSLRRTMRIDTLLKIEATLEGNFDTSRRDTASSDPNDDNSYPLQRAAAARAQAAITKILMKKSPYSSSPTVQQEVGLNTTKFSNKKIKL